MWELLCPQHGIPAFIMWAVLGDPQIILLTLKLWCGKVVSLSGRPK